MLHVSLDPRRWTHRSFRRRLRLNSVDSVLMVMMMMMLLHCVSLRERHCSHTSCDGSLLISVLLCPRSRQGAAIEMLAGKLAAVDGPRRR